MTAYALCAALAVLVIGALLDSSAYLQASPAGDVNSRAEDAAATAGSIPTVIFQLYVDAPMSEIGQLALDYTALNFPILEGTPEVALARHVLASELPGMGLPDLGYRDDDPPLALVIVRGDFERGGSSLRSMFDPPSYFLVVHYIVYIFDLAIGMPVGIGTDVDGSSLRLALNDPSLPYWPIPVNTPRPTPAVSNAALRQQRNATAAAISMATARAGTATPTATATVTARP
jgi:hypothetical protein